MQNNCVADVLNTYKFFGVRKKRKVLFSCVFQEKRYSVFLLNNPKLLYSLAEFNSSLRSAEAVLLNSIKLGEHNQKQNVNNLANKFERKTKNTIRLHYYNDSQDDNKKNKMKKKNRGKSNLISEDIFIDDNNDENVAEFNMALVRPIKINKSQRKKKMKKGSIDINSDKFIQIGSVQDITSERSINNKLSLKKQIVLDSPLTIQQLSEMLRVTEASIITWLFLQGISVTVNQIVDISIATKVAKHYDFNILGMTEEMKLDSSKHMTIDNSNIVEGLKRSAIVTIFGHVDHGKTTLLDAIKKTNVAHLEVGGITQSIKAYEVEWNYLSSVEKIVFLDTPGHEAFAGMRLRGAEVTDLAVLLVAGDDGLKPQTVEAISYIKSHRIPYIVAINKIDKHGIDINKIKEQLTKYNIIDREWGGKDSIIGISALTGKNIDLLLSRICELSRLQNLRADPKNLAQGLIIEANLDKKIGPVATLVIKNGTLKVGDIIVAGNIYARVKLIVNTLGNKILKAGPSQVVSMWGFSAVPPTGLKFLCVNDEKEARKIILDSMNLGQNIGFSKQLNSRVTLENCSENSGVKQVNLILKADTQGSIEAIIHSFSQISQEKVQINLISYGSGSVSGTDIDLAITSGSLILGFNTYINRNISSSIEKLGLLVKNFNVIYDLLDYVRDYMLDLVDPEFDKILIGQATVQTVFNINKGTVAGCIVDSGKLRKNAHISVYRNSKLIYSGILNSLKRLKDDVQEVLLGNECGVMCLDYNFWTSNDIIEAYDLVEKPKNL